MRITRTTARKVLEVVDAGLVKGLGKPVPGQMCVEAAVCYALGLPHGDEPDCVSPALRSLKIALNDADWSSNAARAAGLRKLAILQLGTAEGFDEKEFFTRVALFVGQTILADCFTELAASHAWTPEHLSDLTAAAAALRTIKTLSELESAARSSRSAAESAALSVEWSVESAERARDKVLAIFAEGVAQILIAMGVQSAKWLGLL